MPTIIHHNNGSFIVSETPNKKPTSSHPSKVCTATLSSLWKGSPAQTKPLQARVDALPKPYAKNTAEQSTILRDLAKLQKAFENPKPYDRALIEKTIKTLPAPILNRLYFHLHLLHACKGKKTDRNYGELAFKGVKEHSASNTDRATALRHLLLEQLAIGFSSLKKPKSKTLKDCFTSLPKKDRSDIYFNTYELRHAQLKGSGRKLDQKDGRTFFLKEDGKTEANRLRGNAIYSQLLRSLNKIHAKASSTPTKKKSKKAHAKEHDLQKELAQFKKFFETHQVSNSEMEMVKKAHDMNILTSCKLQKAFARELAEKSDKIIQLTKEKSQAQELIQRLSQEQALLSAKKAKKSHAPQMHIILADPNDEKSLLVTLKQKVGKGSQIKKPAQRKQLIKTLKAQFEDLTIQSAKAGRDLQIANQDRQVLNQEVLELQQRSEKLEAALQQNRAAIQDLETEKAELLRSSEAVQKKASDPQESEGRINGLEKELVSLNKEKQQLVVKFKKTILDLNQQVLELQQKSEALQLELQKYRVAIKKLETEKAEALKASEIQQKKAADPKNDEQYIAELEEQLEFLKNEKQQLSDRLEETVKAQQVLKPKQNQPVDDSLENVEDTNPLSAELGDLFNERISDLKNAQRNVLRTNYALMHLKKMRFVSPSPHLQVQFENDHVPKELPGCEFSARAPNAHNFNRKVNNKHLVIKTDLCPKVAEHVCDKLDRSFVKKDVTKIAENVRDLEKGLAEAFTKASQSGTILHQIQLLSSDVRQFMGSKGKLGMPTNALASVTSLYDELMKRLNQPGSAKIAKLQMKCSNILVDDSQEDDSQKPEKTETQKQAEAQKQTYVDQMALLYTRYAKQIELQQEIQEIEDAGEEENAGKVTTLTRQLKTLILSENIFDELTRKGSLARDILRLEFVLDRLSIRSMRRSPKLREAYSFIDEVRPILKGTLQQLRQNETFKL